jgi:hypothetical protein
MGATPSRALLTFTGQQRLGPGLVGEDMTISCLWRVAPPEGAARRSLRAPAHTPARTSPAAHAAELWRRDGPRLDLRIAHDVTPVGDVAEICKAACRTASLLETAPGAAMSGKIRKMCAKVTRTRATPTRRTWLAGQRLPPDGGRMASAVNALAICRSDLARATIAQAR